MNYMNLSEQYRKSGDEVVERQIDTIDISPDLTAGVINAIAEYAAFLRTYRVVPQFQIDYATGQDPDRDVSHMIPIESLDYVPNKNSDPTVDMSTYPREAPRPLPVLTTDVMSDIQLMQQAPDPRIASMPNGIHVPHYPDKSYVG